MEMTVKSRRYSGFALKAVLLATSSVAALPALAAEGGIGDIIVTATKRAENLQDVPVSISAVGAEQLTSRGVTASQDLGTVVPNLQVSSQYGETSPNFSLRGVGVANEFTANTASPIGVYVDEVSQTFRYTHGLQLYDLDRVEVLRGPQGTLFGRNTTGGAISMYSRQPKLGDMNGNLTVGYGNYNRWKVQGAFEVTPVEEKVGLRVAFMRAKGDGYFKDPVKARAKNGYGTLDTVGARAILRLKPSEKLDITLKGAYAKDDPVGYSLHYIGLVGANAQGQGGTDFFGSTRAGLKYNQVALDKGGKFVTKMKAFSGVISYQIDDNWSVTSVTGYTDSDYGLDIDNDSTPQDAYFIFYRSKGKDFSQDFRINFDSEKFKGLLGVYYGKDTINTNNTVLAYNVLPDAPAGTLPQNWAPGVANSFNVQFGYKQKRKTFAVYTENTYSFTEKLDLTLGLRYTKDHVDYIDGYSQPIVDQPPGTKLFDLYTNLDHLNSYSNWSGRAIINYAWTDDVKTYFSFSRGYRSGTYNGFGFVTPAAVYFVEPERLDSFELGFKSRFADDRIQINGAGFLYDYKNQQVLEVVGGVSFPRNLDAKVKGFEMEVLAKPVSALTLRASLGFLDTNYKKIATNVVSGINVGGNEVPFASKWTLSFGGDLTVAHIADGDVIVSAEVAYKSRVWYDMFNDNSRPPAVAQDGQGGIIQLYPGGKTDLVRGKGYALINGRLSWVSERFTVAVWGKNIANKKYYPFGYDTAGAFGTVLLTPGMPRTFGAEASVRF